MRDAIRKEINGLFDNSTFLNSETTSPTDKVIPVQLPRKAKVNTHNRPDKLKARIC